MASHMALQREDYLNQLHHIISYLKKNHRTKLVFDPSIPSVETIEFECRLWVPSEFSHILKEVVEIQLSTTHYRGIRFAIRAKVNTDHASN